MKCPECFSELEHRPKDGQGVTFCEKCNVSWLILKLKEYPKDDR